MSTPSPSKSSPSPLMTASVPPMTARWFKAATPKAMQPAARSAEAARTPSPMPTVPSSSVSTSVTTSPQAAEKGKLTVATEAPATTTGSLPSPSILVTTAGEPGGMSTPTTTTKQQGNAPKQDEEQAKLLSYTSAGGSLSAVGGLSGANLQWLPFNAQESTAVESAYQLYRSHQQKQVAGLSSKNTDRATLQETVERRHPVTMAGTRIWGKVTIQDLLYEVDIQQREVYPIYWNGSVFPVMRGTWFFYDSSLRKWQPVDEVMALQIEDGYLKHQPWKHFVELPEGVEDPEAQAKNKALLQQPDRFRWNLFGPYREKYVVYSGVHQAWLMEESVTSSLFKAIYSRISAGENLGGIRLIRGFEQMEKAVQKAMRTTPATTNVDMVDSLFIDADSGAVVAEEEDLEGTMEAVVSEKEKEKEATKLDTLNRTAGTLGSKSSSAPLEPAKKIPKIQHLVLCVHGIGQKLTEKTASINKFHEDVNDLRDVYQKALQAHQTAGASPAPGASSTSQTTSPKSKNPPSQAALKPVENSIIVLPIEWRSKLMFDKLEPDSDEPSVEDVLPDGVPAIRTLVSHVILDVLLYMSPKHRNEMIAVVIEELNRVYGLFLERHPYFEAEGGKVHLMAHSLGTLIAMDILCHHSFVKRELRNQNYRRENRSSSTSSTAPMAPNAPGVDLSELGPRLDPAVFVVPKRRLQERRGTTVDTTSADVLTSLKFPVEKYFAVGSPLGLFEVLKKARLGVPMHVMKGYIHDWVAEYEQREHTEGRPGFRMDSKEMQLMEKVLRNEVDLHPDAKAIYNIFHPNDPVAMRLEPIVSRSFANQKPLLVPYTKGGLTGIRVNISELASRTTGDLSGLFDSLRFSLVSSIAFRRALMEESKWMSAVTPDSKRPSTSSLETSPSKKDSSSFDFLSSNDPSLVTAPPISHSPPEPYFTTEEIMATLNPRKRRLDFALQELVLENPYLSALGAHFGYWKDEDSAMFMVKEILEDGAGMAPAAGTAASSTLSSANK